LLPNRFFSNIIRSNYELVQAISPLLEREAPGLLHLLLSASLEHTPLAALSRPVAGIIKNTLVVTLPGSVKAVKEILEALLSDGIVDHAIDLIKGGTGERVHMTLASGAAPKTDTGCAHSREKHHHHHSHHSPRPRTILSHNPLLPGTLALTPHSYLCEMTYAELFSSVYKAPSLTLSADLL
jgi:gephyrin